MVSVLSVPSLSRWETVSMPRVLPAAERLVDAVVRFVRMRQPALGAVGGCGAERRDGMQAGQVELAAAFALEGSKLAKMPP